MSQVNEITINMLLNCYKLVIEIGNH